MIRTYCAVLVLAICLVATARAPSFAVEPSVLASDADDAIPTTLAADSYYADATSENGAITAFEPPDVREFGSNWTFRAGALVLERSDERPRQLIIVNYFRPVGTALDASQFDHDMRGGPEIDAIRHFGEFGVEFRFFSVNDASGVTAPITAPWPIVPSGTIPFSGPPGNYTSGGTSVSASEYSELRSYELSFRSTLSSYLTILAGYRHIDLNDEIFGSFASPADAFAIRAFNRMDGFQIGGESVLWRPGEGRFRVEGSAKVGIYGDATSNYGNFDMQMATATGVHAALATEWSVTAVLQITPHLAARFGYEGLLLDGVALASEQIGVLNPAAHTGAVENSGTPIYQGLVANLEYAW